MITAFKQGCSQQSQHIFKAIAWMNSTWMLMDFTWTFLESIWDLFGQHECYDLTNFLTYALLTHDTPLWLISWLTHHPFTLADMVFRVSLTLY